MAACTGLAGMLAVSHRVAPKYTFRKPSCHLLPWRPPASTRQMCAFNRATAHNPFGQRPD